MLRGRGSLNMPKSNESSEEERAGELRKKWEGILDSKPLFTEAEADGMLKEVMKVRKENGFRKIKY